MDRFGILAFVAFTVLYFVSRQKYPIFAWLSGVGMGILIGAIWAYAIVMGLKP